MDKKLFGYLLSSVLKFESTTNLRGPILIFSFFFIKFADGRMECTSSNIFIKKKNNKFLLSYCHVSITISRPWIYFILKCSVTCFMYFNLHAILTFHFKNYKMAAILQHRNYFLGTPCINVQTWHNTHNVYTFPFTPILFEWFE